MSVPDSDRSTGLYTGDMPAFCRSSLRSEPKVRMGEEQHALPPDDEPHPLPVTVSVLSDGTLIAP